MFSTRFASFAFSKDFEKSFTEGSQVNSDCMFYFVGQVEHKTSPISTGSFLLLWHPVYVSKNIVITWGSLYKRYQSMSKVLYVKNRHRLKMFDFSESEARTKLT